MARYKNDVAFLALLTSGNMEILLFSRFSSSNSRHLAKDLGMADNLLYLRPKRFMLARLPTKKKKVFKILFLWGFFHAVKQNKTKFLYE